MRAASITVLPVVENADSASRFDGDDTNRNSIPNANNPPPHSERLSSLQHNRWRTRRQRSAETPLEMHGDEDEGVRYSCLVPEVRFLADLLLGRVVDSKSKVFGNLFHPGFIPKGNSPFDTSVQINGNGT